MRAVLKGQGQAQDGAEPQPLAAEGPERGLAAPVPAGGGWSRYGHGLQVWVRRLSGGQVGLVALNFASKEATVELRLSQLRLPWGDQMPSLAWDLWRPAVEPWTLHETLHLAGSETIVRHG